MRRHLPILLIVCVTACGSLFAGEDPDPQSPAPPAASATTGYERPVSFAKLVPNLFSDQGKIWSFPAKLNRRKFILPTLAVAGATVALIAVDSHEAPWFAKTKSFSGFNKAFSSSNTEYATLAAPVMFYAAGAVLKGKDRRAGARATALLAGEAVGDYEVIATVMKDAFRRTRPIAVPGAGGNYSDTWFNSPGSFLRGNGSFPSGHTGAAFAVATVVSRRYGNHKWVPWAAYGLASAVGFSRMSLQAHFLSDVFAGGVLGYSIGRFAVLRQ